MLTINHTQIERVDKIKFLGVIIDDKFNWKSHVTYIQAKIAKNIGIIYKVKHLLNTQALFKLYNALILPYLTYCCEVWGNTYKSTLNHLLILQKKVLRHVMNAHFISPSKPIFNYLKTLDLFNLVKLYTVAIMHKAFYNLLPPIIQGNFVLCTDIHSRGTRQKKINSIRNIAELPINLQAWVIEEWNSWLDQGHSFLSERSI